jgi:epoxyqueuosine reductase
MHIRLHQGACDAWWGDVFSMRDHELSLDEFIVASIERLVAEAGVVTQYREPLVGFFAADDQRFLELRRVAEPSHMLPHELQPGARSVVSFFLPFAHWVVEANALHQEQVAEEWATAYVETNALIGRITAHLIEELGARGIGAAAEPATHNFDRTSLVSRWSHKSVAVLAGLGSFGLHQMVITDAGCAGRLGSLVVDADLPVVTSEPRERCLYFYDGSCLECVLSCPIGALDETVPLDKQRCWQRLQSTAPAFEQTGVADACGKCANGPCALESAVAHTTDRREL